MIMAFSNEGKFNEGKEQKNVIKNQEEFWYAFKDAKNQFQAMIMDAAGKFSLEELQERNKKIEYLYFEDYLLKNKNSVIDPKVKDLGSNHISISIYDNLINKIKNFQTIKELQNTLIDVKEYIKENPDVASFIIKNAKIDHYNPEDMSVKNIETEHQFWLWLHDSLVQFTDPRFSHEEFGKEQLVALNKNKEYFTYREWLAREGRNLSPKILNNERVKMLLVDYDDLVARIKGQEDIDEIRQVLEEAKELFQQFKIGLDE